MSRATALNPYSAIANTLFELETKNEFSVSNGKNGFHCDDAILYNVVIGGLFTINNENDQQILKFSSTKLKFNILVAVLKQGYWQLVFRLVASENRVSCVNIEPGQYLQNGVKVPKEFVKESSLVLRVKCDADWNIDMNIKLFGNEYGQIHWDPLSSTTMTDSLRPTNELARTDLNHFRRCLECLITSFDGHGHLPPCAPDHTESHMQVDTYSRKMSRLLQIRFENPRNIVQMFNNANGQFIDLPDTIVNNDVIGGIFTFKNLPSGKKIVSFDATSVNRFGILFAFLHNGSWRVRLSLVFTTRNGVLGFKATKTLYKNNGRFEVPTTWAANTVLFLGVRSVNNEDVPRSHYGNVRSTSILALFTRRNFVIR